MSTSIFNTIAKKYPFLTICKYSTNEYIGIVLNQDKIFTSMYDYGQLDNEEDKKKFLELGETWWWESNRNIPINLFLKSDWDLFKPVLRTFINKKLTVIQGHCPNINNLPKQHKKRKSITLIKNVR
jgi:hypothetical protein